MNPDRAMEWLFSHEEEPESDEEMKVEEPSESPFYD